MTTVVAPTYTDEPNLARDFRCPACGANRPQAVEAERAARYAVGLAAERLQVEAWLARIEQARDLALADGLEAKATEAKAAAAAKRRQLADIDEEVARVGNLPAPVTLGACPSCAADLTVSSADERQLEYLAGVIGEREGVAANLMMMVAAAKDAAKRGDKVAAAQADERMLEVEGRLADVDAEIERIDRLVTPAVAGKGA